MGIVISLTGVLILSFIAPLVVSRLKGYGWYLAFMPFMVFTYFLWFIPEIGKGNVIYYSLPWLPSLGINLSFYLDGLSLLFTLLISGIGTLILIYAGYYMKPYPFKGRFFLYIILFMFSMLGLVLSGNLVTMFLFWELTSISSYLLIGFNHDKIEARKAALQALLITFFGGLALVSGIILLGSITGTYEIMELLSLGNEIKLHPGYHAILILILIGAFTKSAQFPFHFWLPGAMQAPSPVSAYLHSATMVKAGIYLLARLNPVLGGTEIWQNYLTFFGALTMLVGAYLAVTQTDLKKILAYTTVSALGILVLLIGMGTELATKAAVLFLVVHSLYKGSLFMIAGSIDKATGTRDITKLGGLMKKMPITAVTAFLVLLSMAGLPPFLGFIGKELIYEANIQVPDVAIFLLIFGVTANILMVTIATIFAYHVFLGKPAVFEKGIKEVPASLWAGPAILAVLSLAMGLFPEILTQPIVAPAILSINVTPVLLKLKLWHGFNVVLGLSILTVFSGFVIFLIRNRLIPILRRINNRLFAVDFSDLFFRNVDRFLGFTVAHTKVIQNGYHRFYLMTIFIVTSAFVWYQLISTRDWDVNFHFLNVSYFATGLIALVIAGIASAIFTKSRLIAVISLGVIGYGIAIIFVIFGGEELALTLIVTETLLLIILVMVIYHLPKYVHISSTVSRIRDFIIALAVGSFMTVLVLKSNLTNLAPSISGYLAENSYVLGYGRNIVNVILVDFRSLDTLGEIAVLAVAAIGVFALIKLQVKKEEAE